MLKARRLLALASILAMSAPLALAQTSPTGFSATDLDQPKTLAVTFVGVAVTLAILFVGFAIGKRGLAAAKGR